MRLPSPGAFQELPGPGRHVPRHPARSGSDGVTGHGDPEPQPIRRIRRCAASLDNHPAWPAGDPAWPAGVVGAGAEPGSARWSASTPEVAAIVAKLRLRYEARSCWSSVEWRDVALTSAASFG